MVKIKYINDKNKKKHLTFTGKLVCYFKGCNLV